MNFDTTTLQYFAKVIKVNDNLEDTAILYDYSNLYVWLVLLETGSVFVLDLEIPSLVLQTAIKDYGDNDDDFVSQFTLYNDPIQITTLDTIEDEINSLYISTSIISNLISYNRFIINYKEHNIETYYLNTIKMYWFLNLISYAPSGEENLTGYEVVFDEAAYNVISRYWATNESDCVAQAITTMYDYVVSSNCVQPTMLCGSTQDIPQSVDLKWYYRTSMIQQTVAMFCDLTNFWGKIIDVKPSAEPILELIDYLTAFADINTKDLLNAFISLPTELGCSSCSSSSIAYYKTIITNICSALTMIINGTTADNANFINQQMIYLGNIWVNLFITNSTGYNAFETGITTSNSCCSSCS